MTKEEEAFVELPPLSGKGEVWSYTTVYDAPEGFTKYAPYTVALIRLEEGSLVTAMLTDVDNKDVHIGMKVEMVTRLKRDMGKRGMLVYGYMFRPILFQSGKTTQEIVDEILALEP